MTSETHQRVDQAKETALDKIDEAKSKGGELARDQVDQRSTQAGEAVASTAEDVRAVGQTLRDQGNDNAARVVEQAAGYAQQAADYLRDTSPNKILSDVERIARKQPWAVTLGGLLVGFAASRVLRSSARNNDDDDFDFSGAPMGTGAPIAYGDEPLHPADRMGFDAPPVVQQAAERDAFTPQPGVGDPASGLAQPSVAPGVAQGDYDYGDGPAGTRPTTPGGLGGTP
jgi:vacuolar-type H+-ATPase subunit H